MMGGWELAISQTSQNKQLVWELLTIMVDPKIISPWLEQNGLPSLSTAFLRVGSVEFFCLKTDLSHKLCHFPGKAYEK
jgi:hypothetical protein